MPLMASMRNRVAAPRRAPLAGPRRSRSTSRRAVLPGALVLVLLAHGDAAAGTKATPELLRAEPLHATWLAALDAARPAAGAGCATDDRRSEVEWRKHEARAALLLALERRGVLAAPPPAGAGPWPWDAAPTPDARIAVVDTGDVAVLHDDGHILYRNREGQIEVDPYYAARAFYAAHHDEYDFLVLFTNFYSQLGGGSFLAYHLAAANDVTGLGYAHVRSDELFDESARFTRKEAPGRLRSVVHLNDLTRFPDDPSAPYYRQYSALGLLGHELAHRWLARIRLEVPGVGPYPVVLGRQWTHWSFFLQSGPSPLEGNAWAFDGVAFSTLDQPLAYGPLDLYLMGMMGAAEVPPDSLWYVAEPHDFQPPGDPWGGVWAPASPPVPGVSCVGRRALFTIDDVTLANGLRLPAYPDAPRDHRVAFALVVQAGSPFPAPQELAKLERIQQGLRDWFAAQTLGRGSIDTRLRRVPDRIVFAHRPHGDFEDPARPIPIGTEVSLEPWSRPVRLEEVRASLLWSVDGGAAVETPMASAALGQFAAEIPPQALGSSVRYWFRGTSNVPGHEHLWPRHAPDSTFAFRIRRDDRAPTLQHVPLRRWSRLAAPPLLRALVRDAHGVAEVRVEHRLDGGGPLVVVPMQPQGLSDVYEARPELPGRIGSVVEYRILARDVSASPHATSSPASGFHSLVLERALVEDAESEESVWSHRSLRFEGPDQWHREIVNPIGGLYSWKVGPSYNTVPGVIAARQDAAIESPLVQVFPGGAFTMRHRYAFLLDEFQPRYEAIDGGRVEWQDVDRDEPTDRWWPLEPDNGYTHWVTYISDTPFVGQWVFSGTIPFARLETFTFPSDVVDRTIRIRLRVATSSPQNRRRALDGWVVDDLTIDPGPPPTAVALASFEAEQNGAGVRLAWTARDVPDGGEFEVARATSRTPASETGTPPGGGSPPPGFAVVARLRTEPGRSDYSCTDVEAPAGADLLYRLTLLDGGAAIAWREVRVAVSAPRFALHPAVPNPFNPTTRLDFELPARAPARLAIYDVRGRLVRVLADAVLDAGRHRVVWDGSDSRGRTLAAGVYLARLTSAGREAVLRLIVLR